MGGRRGPGRQAFWLGRAALGIVRVGLLLLGTHALYVASALAPLQSWRRELQFYFSRTVFRSQAAWRRVGHRSL